MSEKEGQEQGQGPEEEGPINMDHYYSTRRRGRTPTWPYLISAGVMIVLLVGIVIYQDSCGVSVSDLLFTK